LLRYDILWIKSFLKQLEMEMTQAKFVLASLVGGVTLGGLGSGNAEAANVLASSDRGIVILVLRGQLIMHGREHLVGITAQGKGLVLVILRYADELRKPEPYFEKIETKAKDDAVRLAVDLRATIRPL
jgi:hypothetical protein